jgi:hypothetical protein
MMFPWLFDARLHRNDPSVKSHDAALALAFAQNFHARPRPAAPWHASPIGVATEITSHGKVIPL